MYCEHAAEVGGLDLPGQEPVDDRQVVLVALGLLLEDPAGRPRSRSGTGGRCGRAGSLTRCLNGVPTTGMFDMLQMIGSVPGTVWSPGRS